MQSTSHNPAKGGKAADKGPKAGKATPGPAEGGKAADKATPGPAEGGRAADNARPGPAEGGKAAEGMQGAEGALGALRLGGGTWEASAKVALSDAQYLPLQVLSLGLGSGSGLGLGLPILKVCHGRPATPNPTPNPTLNLQPVERARRRPSGHCRESLFRYLEEQAAREAAWARGEAPAGAAGSDLPT